MKIEYTDITPTEFAAKMAAYGKNPEQLFVESGELEKEIKKQLAGLKHAQLENEKTWCYFRNVSRENVG